MPAASRPSLNISSRALQPIADAAGCTLAQLALAWLLHQGPDIVPIPGTRSARRLDENATAAHLRLGGDPLARLDRVLQGRPVSGERYPPQAMATING